MTEYEFWLSLEFRICREFEGMVDKALRGLWCDGFVPELFHLKDPVPRIEGTAWMCSGPKQEEWQFTLFLTQPFASSNDIDWSSLLPAEDATRWIAVDLCNKRIQFEPSAAVPDDTVS